MKNNILNHIDLWLKMLFRHFDKHKIHGGIFFLSLSFAIITWSAVLLSKIINN